MTRCKRCGHEAILGYCPNCEFNETEHVMDESDSVFDAWMEITCMGDQKRRYMHTVTGAIREEEFEPYRLP